MCGFAESCDIQQNGREETAKDQVSVGHSAKGEFLNLSFHDDFSLSL